MSKLPRLALLGFAMWAAYLGSAAFKARGEERFAEGATLAGVGVFGASIMLISQMYHIEGNPPDAVLLWALGALGAGVLLGANTALAAAALLGVLWSGWQTQLTGGIHLAYLPLWAALAAAFYGRGWWPGLHLALASFAFWFLQAVYGHGRAPRHDLVLALGVAAAVGSAWLATWRTSLSTAASTATAYASVIAFIGAYGWQFLERTIKGPGLIVLAVLVIALLLALIAWGWRTSNRSLVWLGYAVFSVQILGLYFRTIGSLLGTSLFFLSAGVIVALLAWIAYRLLHQPDDLKPSHTEAKS
jgi:uncharacterized membrane protein